jgi:hypothetical protein
MNQDVDTIPWYRQVWPWLVFLPPAVAVLGGFATLYLAFSHADPEVCGHYVRDAFAAREEAGSPATRHATDCLQ